MANNSMSQQEQAALQELVDKSNEWIAQCTPKVLQKLRTMPRLYDRSGLYASFPAHVTLEILSFLQQDLSSHSPASALVGYFLGDSNRKPQLLFRTLAIPVQNIDLTDGKQRFIWSQVQRVTLMGRVGPEFSSVLASLSRHYSAGNLKMVKSIQLNVAFTQAADKMELGSLRPLVRSVSYFCTPFTNLNSTKQLSGELTNLEKYVSIPLSLEDQSKWTNFKQLRSLDMLEIQKQNAQKTAEILLECSSLKQLFIIVEYGLSHSFLTKMTQLTSLSLDSNNPLEPGVLPPNLKRLCIMAQQCPSNLDVAVAHLQHLERISVRVLQITDEKRGTQEVCASLSRLRVPLHLDLGTNDIDTSLKVIRELLKLGKIESLKLPSLDMRRYWDHSTLGDLFSFGGMTGLRSLDLSAAQFKVSILHVILEHPSLKRLVVWRGNLNATLVRSLEERGLQICEISNEEEQD